MGGGGGLKLDCTILCREYVRGEFYRVNLRLSRWKKRIVTITRAHIIRNYGESYDDVSLKENIKIDEKTFHISS